MDANRPQHPRAIVIRHLRGVSSLAALVAGTLAFFDPAMAHAQATPADNTPSVTPPASQTEPGEIVVTAQRRTERLQDVPVSVQVLGTEALKEQNINALESISQISPAVHVGLGTIADQLYIRGIGSGGNPSFDQAVGTFIDDIYHGRSRTSSATFLDLERVEVLKGPQSTFFGNNAIAGAFNIITKEPTETVSGSARFLYGSYGERVAEVAGGGPLTDKLAVRAVLHYDGLDGWLTNTTSGRRVPERNDVAGRISFLYKPTDNLQLRFKAEASANRQEGIPYEVDLCPPPAPFPSSGFCALGLSQGLGPDFGLGTGYNTQNPSQYISLSTSEYVLNASLEKWGHTFTSVTGYSRFDYAQNLDADGIPSDQILSSIPERYHQFSQELRVASPSNQKVEYLFGGYFQSDSFLSGRTQTFPFQNATILSRPTLAALFPYLPIGQDIQFTQNEQSYAAFGSVTWNISHRLKLTAGLRGSWVHKDFTSVIQYGSGDPNGIFTYLSGTISPLPAAATGLQSLAGSVLGTGPAGTLAGSRTDHAVLPSVNAQYFFNPNVMVYARYAKGFLAGGFNGQETSGDPTNAPFAPEHVDAYEVGFKSELFNRHLTFNIDAFTSNYVDLQVAQSIQRAVGTRTFVTNAASALSRGIEAEGVLRVTPAFRIAANVSYIDSHFVSYTNVALTTLGTFCHTAANLGNTICVATFGGNGDPGATRDVSGQVTPFSPRWAGNVSADYTFDAGPLRISPSVTGIFSSGYFPSGSQIDEPLMRQPGYVRLDGRITLTSPKAAWKIDLIGRNINNVAVESFAVALPSALGTFTKIREQPRSFDIQLRLDW